MSTSPPLRQRVPVLVARFGRTPPLRVAAVGGLAVLAFTALGAVYALAKDGGPVPAWFRSVPVGLNTEWSLPAIYSGVLLLATGLLALHARSARPSTALSAALLVLGVLFTFMAFDEVLAIHERIESAAGLDWFVLYTPVAVVAGLALLVVLRLSWDHRGVRLTLAGGGLCWLVSQLIETQQYEDGELVRRWTILPEEALEMTGSLLFLLAMLMLCAWQRSVPPVDADAGSPA